MTAPDLDFATRVAAHFDVPLDLLLAAAIRRADPDYDIDGPLHRWDHELEAERHDLGNQRALAQTDAARAVVAREKALVRDAGAWDDPTRILDEEVGE